jgi:hypothetical protein
VLWSVLLEEALETLVEKLLEAANILNGKQTNELESRCCLKNQVDHEANCNRKLYMQTSATSALDDRKAFHVW